jgi:hypothetical protein
MNSGACRPSGSINSAVVYNSPAPQEVLATFADTKVAPGKEIIACYLNEWDYHLHPFAISIR